MSRVRVKFCGMTRNRDLRAACAAGVDAVGLVFAPVGPRALSVQQARRVLQGVHPMVCVVALFMDPPAALVEQVIREIRPALLQFHGSEDATECRRWGVPYLRAVPMGDLPDEAAVLQWCARFEDAAGYVLDAHHAGGVGGAGRTFDWSRVPRGLGSRAILAGGLSPANVASAIDATGVRSVDVSSGVESEPGIKDEEAMRRFIKEVSHVTT